MKGQITIEATEKGLHLTGHMVLEYEEERYEIVRALTRSLDIDSVEELAALSVYCLGLLDDKTCTLKHTKIVVPIKKEKENETDAL